MFREAFVRESFDFDFMYDWIVKKQALKQRLQQAHNQRQQEAKQVAERQQNFIDKQQRRQLPTPTAVNPPVGNPTATALAKDAGE